MGKLLIALIMILIVVGYVIVKVNSLDLHDSEDQKEFILKYGELVYKATINIKSVIGFVIKQDWSVNETENES